VDLDPFIDKFTKVSPLSEVASAAVDILDYYSLGATSKQEF
jgi:hypothetical protein